MKSEEKCDVLENSEVERTFRCHPHPLPASYHPLVSLLPPNQMLACLLHGVPVEDVVVRKSLAVEQVSNELPQVSVVGLLLEAEGATKVEVSSKLG